MGASKSIRIHSKNLSIYIIILYRRFVSSAENPLKLMLIDRIRPSSPRKPLPLAPLIILHRLKPNLVKCSLNFDQKAYHLHVYDVYYVPVKRGRKNTDPRKNVKNR